MARGRKNNNNNESRRMVLISLHLPKHMVEELDRLVEQGYFPNRSEAIRQAIAFFLRNIGEIYSTLRDRRIPIVPGR